jgi:UDP-N-acetylmuramate--alanine ligase
VLAAFPGAFPIGVHAEVVGNPVRSAIAALPAPDQRLAGREGPLRLLVLGGSQGALALNQAVPEALARLRPMRAPRCATRRAATPSRRPARPTSASASRPKSRSSSTTWPAAYGWADLAICRAGALTVSELAAAGVPAVLVPFPAAVDDHQTLNGGYLVAAGGAVLVPEHQLNADRLARLLAGLLADRGRLLDMARRARGAARPRALAEIEQALPRRAGSMREAAMKDRMRRVHRIHFVGIGGSGMGGIAEVLLNLGYQVQGSDLKANAGHAAPGVARREGGARPQRRASRGRGRGGRLERRARGQPGDRRGAAARIPVVKRAEMLAELMRFRYGIAVAGTHGKTTTTSLVASVLAEAGLDPTFVIGGRLNSANTHARLGAGASWLPRPTRATRPSCTCSRCSRSSPTSTDHMATYGGDFERLKQTFIEFLHNLPFYGLAIVCWTTPGLGLAAGAHAARGPDLRLRRRRRPARRRLPPGGPGTHFSVHRPDHDQPLEVTLNLPGRHNVLNALAAIAVAQELEVPDAAHPARWPASGHRPAHAGARRARRRRRSALLVDDYGHHPTELERRSRRFAGPGRAGASWWPSSRTATAAPAI